MPSAEEPAIDRVRPSRRRRMQVMGISSIVDAIDAFECVVRIFLEFRNGR